MERWEKNVIMDNLSRLRERTTANNMLLAILQANDVLSPDDVSIIKSPSGVLEKSMNLYEIIVSRRNGYNVLLEALEQTKQTSAAYILFDAKRKVMEAHSTANEDIPTEESEGDQEDNRDNSTANDGNRENGTRFAACVDGLQNLINSSEHQITLISSMDSKLTVSKIKDTLSHPKIWIKEIGTDGKFSIDQTSEEQFNGQDGNKNADPLWIFYENTSDLLYSDNSAAVKAIFYEIVFRYLLNVILSNIIIRREKLKLILVLQCDKQTVEKCLSEIDISNAQLIADHFSWEQLTTCTQVKLLKHPQLLLDRGVLKSIGHLLRLYVYEKDSHLELLNELLQGQLLVDILNDKSPEIFRKTIPQVKTNYYIPRRLRKRSCISKSIFKSDSEHDIIVVADIMKDLNQSDILNDFANSFGAWNRTVDFSINQKKKLTAKFILLSNPNDFDQICKAATAKDRMCTVHLLAYNSKRFFWRETRGACNMHIIHSNICTEYQHEFSEDATIKANQKSDGEQEKADDKELTELLISKASANEPIIICDAPGMGKSIFLASLANKTERMTDRKNSLVLFFLMTDFISSVGRHLNENETDISLDTLKEVIYGGVSAYDLKKSLLDKSSTVAPTSLYLFFDGLDEVPVDSLELAYSCLQKIRDELKPARLYITTRRNLLEQVETKLKTLAYNIQPFSHNDQLEFLTRFWSSLRLAKGEEIKRDVLLAYAKLCLKALEKNTGKKNIAEIPLQCLIIGEVFHDDAQEYSQSKSQYTEESIRSTITINSLNELYERMFQTKYETFRKRYLHEKELQLYTQALERVHTFVAIKNLFTEKNYHEQLGHFLLDEIGFKALKHIFGDWNGNFDEFHAGALPRQGLLNVGFLETVGDGALKFIHKTLAEYLVAKFSASHLLSPDAPSEINGYIKQAIFSTDPEDVTISQHFNLIQNSCKFKFPVICNFLNSFVPTSFHFIDNENGDGDMTENNQVDENIVHACIHGNHENILYYLFKPNTLELSTEQRCNFLLFAAHSPSKKIFDLFQYKHDLFPKCGPSPLHIAVEYGNKAMVNHLLAEYGLRKAVITWDATELHRLIHLCIFKTKEKSEDSLNDRVAILSALEKTNPGIISIVIKKVGMLTIFEACPHINILSFLIQHVESEFLLKNEGNDNKNILQLAEEYLSPQDNSTFVSVMESHHKNFLETIGYFVEQERRRVAARQENLVVGDEQNCQCFTIVKAMSKSSVFSVLDTKWILLALEFGTPLDVRSNLPEKRLMGLQSTITIIEKLLLDWSLRLGKKATLKALIGILVRNNMNAIAECVKKEFDIPSES